MRSRTVVGIELLTGFVADGPGNCLRIGRIYNPLRTAKPTSASSRFRTTGH